MLAYNPKWMALAQRVFKGWSIPRRGKHHYVILVRTESGAVLAFRGKVPTASRVLDRKIFDSIARAWNIPAQ